MKKIVRLTERDLTRLVKRVIKEDRFWDTENRLKSEWESDIKSGDDVFIPFLEYSGTVLKVNDNGTVTIDGPYGEETFNIKNVKKMGHYHGKIPN